MDHAGHYNERRWQTLLATRKKSRKVSAGEYFTTAVAFRYATKGITSTNLG